MPVTPDRGGAGWLVHTCSDLILRLSYTYFKSTNDVQDICQTVFLKLLQKPRAFSSPKHREAWVTRMAANLYGDHLKSGWRRAIAALDAAETASASTEGEGNPLSAVNLLPPKYCTVIYLYYYEGCAAREIAQFLDEKPATVSTQLNRGRQQFHTLLGSEGMA